MQVYIDDKYMCHKTYSPEFRRVESDILDGMCNRAVNGYRYIPAGESWVREDGTVFAGEMIAPAEDIRLLEAAQEAYEEAMAANADALAALDVLGVQP